MNIQMWNGELEIFDDDSVFADGEESMFHGWFVDAPQVGKSSKRLAFIIGADCVLSSEIVDGRTIYSIEKIRCRDE